MVGKMRERHDCRLLLLVLLPHLLLLTKITATLATTTDLHIVGTKDLLYHSQRNLLVHHVVVYEQYTW